MWIYYMRKRNMAYFPIILSFAFCFFPDAVLSIGCVDGDKLICDEVRASNCSGSLDLQDVCCEKCKFLIENDEEDCPFGAGKSHECYDDHTRKDCCNFCYSEYDGSMADDCVFGDRAPDTCLLISGKDCFDTIVSHDCCKRCLNFVIADNSDSCEYGDAISNCVESECARYSASDIQGCCSTCSDYVTPDDDVTESASSRISDITESALLPAVTSTPVSTKSFGVTQKPEKQSATGPIIGGVVGGVIVLVLIIVVAFFLWRRKYKADKPLSFPPPASFLSYNNKQSDHNQPEPRYVKPNFNNHPGSKTHQPTDKHQTNKEEVYDYISADDVKSVISEPAFRPALPDRDLSDQGYMTPQSSLGKYGDLQNQGYLTPQTSLAKYGDLPYHEYMKVYADSTDYYKQHKGNGDNAVYYSGK